MLERGLPAKLTTRSVRINRGMSFVGKPDSYALRAEARAIDSAIRAYLYERTCSRSGVSDTSR
jgi:hypothetical protein